MTAPPLLLALARDYVETVIGLERCHAWGDAESVHVVGIDWDDSVRQYRIRATEAGQLRAFAEPVTVCPACLAHYGYGDDCETCRAAEEADETRIDAWVGSYETGREVHCG